MKMLQVAILVGVALAFAIGRFFIPTHGLSQAGAIESFLCLLAGGIFGAMMLRPTEVGGWCFIAAVIILLGYHAMCPTLSLRDPAGIYQEAAHAFVGALAGAFLAIVRSDWRGSLTYLLLLVALSVVELFAFFTLPKA